MSGYRVAPAEPVRPKAVDIARSGTCEPPGEFPPDLLLLRPRSLAEKTQELCSRWSSFEQFIYSCVTGVLPHEEIGASRPFVPVVEDCMTSHWVQDDALRLDQKLPIGRD